MKSWEEISQEERDKWNDIASKVNNIQKLFITLVKSNKCIWCNKKMNIIRKNPETNISLNSYQWFTPEFLVHAQTTHGYNPEIITDFLKQIK